MTTRKIIPIGQIRPLTPDEIDRLHRRLDDEGYMRMMQIGEPRLAELVTKYKGKGYEVEVVPYVDDGDDVSTPPSGGCGPGSCSAGANPSSCGSGGCGSEGSQTGEPVTSTSARRAGSRKVVPGVGTIYVRMNTAQGVV